MKLSLKMISERLEQQVRILKFKDIFGTIRLSRPIFLTDETTLLANTLYISSADQLPENLTYEEGSALILSGSSDMNIISSPAVILTDPEIDIFRIHNYVNQIFDFFDNWQSQMDQAAFNCGRLSAFEKFMNCSSALFENTLILADPSFNYMISRGDDASSADHYLFKRIPEESLLKLQKSPILHRLMTEQEIFIASDEAIPGKYMVRNIFHENSIMYRVAIRETARPFRETDYLFLELFAQYIDRLIQKDYSVSASDDSLLSKLLSSAIASAKLNKALLHSELDKIRWAVSDNYMIIYVASNDQNLLVDSIPYYCMEIIRDFPGIFAFNYRNHIILLINLDHYEDSETDTQEIMESTAFQPLKQFINSFHLHAGISNHFCNLYDIRRFYRQAVVACEIGSRENPEQSVAFFSSCVLSYMFNMASAEFSREDLLSPVYVRLFEYDKQNNTEYLKTLREYLDQNMNAVQTAANLFIHRATLIYRIKRLCEIGKTDLKDPEELLHISLSFRLAESTPPKS